jgi:hypothetical protein
MYNGIINKNNRLMRYEREGNDGGAIIPHERGAVEESKGKHMSFS